MKLAIVHDALREYGGAERVLEVLHQIYPEAPVFTAFVDKRKMGTHWDRFASWDIRTSAYDTWWFRRWHSPLRFLAPKVWRSLDLSVYDIVLTSSGWLMCRGVNHTAGQRHVCYLHHPPRNLYGYATGGLYQRYAIVRLYALIVNRYVRHYDFEISQSVDTFIANSEETKRRIAKFYRRDATVVYPPITIPDKLDTPQRSKKDAAYLSVGRLTYAKRLDLLIAACNQRKIPLRIVGQGPEKAYLQSLAGPTITFLGGITDDALNREYRQAKALLFCARQEDFGMVPVEAMAYGTPVIGLAEGGVKETIRDGKTGVLFTEATEQAVMAAIERFEQLPYEAWEHACRTQAKRFSVMEFKRRITSIVG